MEQPVPFSIEAEQGVLGSIIIDPNAILEIAEFLHPEHFYRDVHRIIYEAIMHLQSRREKADFITLCDLLEQRHQLQQVGGPGYITSLINCVPTSGNVAFYGRIVERISIQRRLMQLGGQIVSWACEEEDAGQALQKTEQAIFEISQSYQRSLATDVHIRDVMTAYMQRLSNLSKLRGKITGVPSGFTDLDRLTGGLQRSDLLILAGRPGTGKSSMATSLAYNAALEHQQRIGIFSLEMSREQIGQRLLSIATKINQQRLRSGWIEDEEWEKVVESTGKLSGLDIWIDDTAGISVSELRSKARRWVSDYGVQLVIVDYLQLMKSGEQQRRTETREQEVSAISRNLKGVARELDIPVLALAQLSRAVEGRQSKVPQLSDLRESGAIENDADIVMFIYRDDLYNPETERPSQADIIVAKHRNGDLGTIVLHFERSLTHFRDMEVSPPSLG